MSKLSKAVKEVNKRNELKLDETTKNFMNGDSYLINALDTLKMISASSIFAEPSYYRNSKNSVSGILKINKLIYDNALFTDYDYKTTDEIFEDAIDKALDYDFKGTLEWALTLRKDFYMRLNPQVIITRAAIHPKRKEFTAANPGLFNKINQQIMQRADEPMTQMAYYLYINQDKKHIPSILKDGWKEKISSLNTYNINKYKNHEIGLINAVRLCHANSEAINELMQTGTIKVEQKEKTWEQYKSEGKDWSFILNNCNLGHMALLRNLRGVFTEINNIDVCNTYLSKLKNGVVEGKQFPFRYWSALKAIKDSNVNHKSLIIDALEECMDISIQNFPKLKGKTMCLSDNSGSAWGSFNSEYGSVTVAEIDNLSSVLTAMCSDEGYVGKFGDQLKIFPITKRNGALMQTDNITHQQQSDVGGATEGGIWEFFKNAIDNKEHWDNIFIYSDMQAGHGGLYGTYSHKQEYTNKGYNCNGDYINVFKLILDYRKLVNPKVNVFCIQTAGYNNVLIPEYAYRTNIMYGWTGKEALFAKTIIDQWNTIEGI